MHAFSNFEGLASVADMQTSGDADGTITVAHRLQGNWTTRGLADAAKKEN